MTEEELLAIEAYWADCFAENDICRLAAEVRKANADAEALRKLLKEAAEDIASWGGYASEYFQEKHDLAACVKRYTDAAKERK